MTTKKNTTWASWAAVALVLVMVSCACGRWVQVALRTETDQRTAEEKSNAVARQIEEETQKAAQLRVSIGDTVMKVEARCGQPDEISRVENANGSFSVWSYKNREGIPFDCLGQIGIVDGIVRQISWSSY